ncbi:MAG: hydroxyacylglutathione hydrolase [Gammaproteobacteria bacterium]|nr:hydroxyacylglutathione hydrolase [Gammaproteobacteria bacterium]
MTPKITAVPAFDDNYIWCIENKNSSRFIAVDPGDAKVVIEHAQTNNQQLVAIFVTHHHADHTGGIETLIRHFGDMPVYGPSHSPYAGITHELQHHDLVHEQGLEFSILEIPGHTLDHIAYYNREQGILFCGDTLFLAGCGRVFEGTAEQMYTSLKKIMALPATTQAYPTHEYSLANLKFAVAVENDNKALLMAQRQCQQMRALNQITLPTQLAQEAAINPFVRAHKQSVMASASKHAGKPLNSPSEVFTILREWKNSF